MRKLYSFLYGSMNERLYHENKLFFLTCLSICCIGESSQSKKRTIILENEKSSPCWQMITKCMQDWPLVSDNAACLSCVL